MRIVCSVEYNGYGFCGWQKQPKTLTIQGLIEKALFEIAKKDIKTHASGRTDKGVHALGQVFHFDTTEVRPMHAWVKGVNAFLPESVRIQWAMIVDESFHARHSVKEREYQYLLVNDSYNSAPFHSNVGWTYYKLNTKLIKLSCLKFKGKHDFTSFRSSECQAKSPIRTIKQFHYEEYGKFHLFTITADGFLHHQIRNMIATIIHIAKGSEPLEYISELLTKKNRKYAPPTFMPNGLYLTNIKYDEKWKFPISNNKVNILSTNYD